MTGNQCGRSSHTKISRRTIKFQEISRISRRVFKFQEISRISRSCRHPDIWISQPQLAYSLYNLYWLRWRSRAVYNLDLYHYVFFSFQNGGRLPSWIFKIFKLYWLIGSVGLSCITKPNFIKIGQSIAEI